MPKEFRYVDLFANICALHSIPARSGGHCIHLLEIDSEPRARVTLLWNIADPRHRRKGDIISQTLRNSSRKAA